MKRFLTLFLSLILSLSSLMLISCKESNNIVFTATKPEYTNLTIFENEKTNYLSVSNASREEGVYPPDGTSCFNFFKQKYEHNIKNKIDGGFYFLDPGDGNVGFYPDLLYKTFDFYADDYIDAKYLNPILSQAVYIDNLPFVTYQNHSSSNNGDARLILQFFYTVLPNEITSKDFTLEFGNNYTDYNPAYNYINIYVGDYCLGTCFYRICDCGCVELNSGWFEQYFESYMYRA
ncbi:MAG: hypothetical protein J6B16_06240 [Clostridia bacterium]|nr:hypothetical protein [Clostridia bacterium]